MPTGRDPGSLYGSMVTYGGEQGARRSNFDWPLIGPSITRDQRTILSISDSVEFAVVVPKRGLTLPGYIEKVAEFRTGTLDTTDLLHLEPVLFKKSIGKGHFGEVFLVWDFNSREEHVPRGTLAELSINCLCILCFGTAKASALLFYRRVFCGGGKHPTLRRTILAALLVLLAWMLLFEFMTILQCGTHFDAPWDGTRLRYCTWSNPSIEGVAVSDVLLDVFVVALPIYPISKLATSQKNRIAIAGVFLVALVGFAASITRLVIVKRVIAVGHEALNEDMEYYISKTMFYFLLEAGVSVTVLNLPPIWTALGGDAKLLSGFATVEDEESN